MLMPRLTRDDQAVIRAALNQAEARTHARFAISVIPVSDRYLAYPLAWSGLLAMLAGGVLAALCPEMTLRMAFLIEAAVFAVATLALDWLPLRLLLVPRALQHRRAQALAHREFAAHILSSGRSGMLFFVSLGERYVEILADRTVHERVGEKTWNEIVDAFAANARQGKVLEGLLAAVERCADLLETHFPKPGST
jgi:putative membrane protein